jgi:hypothetical protein
MEAEQRIKREQTRERAPPLALAEILNKVYNLFNSLLTMTNMYNNKKFIGSGLKNNFDIIINPEILNMILFKNLIKVQ